MPKSAVVNATTGIFVIRVTDGKAEHVAMQTGRIADGKVEIYGNLNPGDTLVKTANEEIRDGSEIANIKKAEARRTCADARTTRKKVAAYTTASKDNLPV